MTQRWRGRASQPFARLLRSNQYPYVLDMLESNVGNVSVPWKSVSFSCGGWLQFYLFGVARAFQARNLDKNMKFLGCSAGALAAAGIALGGDFDLAVQFCKDDCLPRAHSSIRGLFDLARYVSEAVDLACNLHKWDQLQPEQLQIAITRLPWLQNERATTFTSREDLKSCLMASAAPFPLAPLVYRRGAWCVDGGLSDFQPIIDEETITISPFYCADATIKPSRYVPLWWALIPPNDNNTIDWLYSLGYEDGLAYITSQIGPACVPPLPKPQHPFDVPKQVSMHRFIGFNLHEKLHPYVAIVLDYALLLLLLFVWKPVAVALIYAELAIVAAFQIVRIICTEIYDIVPMVILCGTFITQMYLVFSIGVVFYVYKLYLLGVQCQQAAQSMVDVLQCMFSLSLMLRIIPTLPSKELLRKHVILEKLSLTYRLVRHFI